MAITVVDERVKGWVESLGVQWEGLMRLELVISKDDVIHVKTWHQVEGEALAEPVPFKVEERKQAVGGGVCQSLAGHYGQGGIDVH